MDLSNIVGLLVGMLVGIILLLALWAVLVRRRTKEIGEQETPPASLASVSDAKFEPDEQVASLVGEQIEEMVRHSLSTYPDLADVKLDFATGPDESLVVWVNAQSYSDIGQIPDHRIRTAISEAVQKFNQ